MVYLNSVTFPTVLVAPTITMFTAVNSTQLDLVWMVSHVRVCVYKWSNICVSILLHKSAITP